jgi:hypothetical protein
MVLAFYCTGQKSRLTGIKKTSLDVFGRGNGGEGWT